MGHIRIIARVLGVPGNREKYHGYIEAYMESIFDRDAMFAKIDFVSSHVRPMVSLNGDDAIERFDRMLADEPSIREQNPLKFFVVKRHESINAQLAGTAGGESVGFGEFPLPRQLVPIMISLAVLALLSTIGWIWGIVAGFRGSTLWGCLNIFFSPLAPAIYGFGVRRDLGFKCAVFATLCIFGWIAWVVFVVNQFSN